MSSVLYIQILFKLGSSGLSTVFSYYSLSFSFSVLPIYFDTQYCHVHVHVAQSEHIGSFQYLEYGLLLRLSLPFYKMKKQFTFMGNLQVQRVYNKRSK